MTHFDHNSITSSFQADKYIILGKDSTGTHDITVLNPEWNCEQSWNIFESLLQNEMFKHYTGAEESSDIYDDIEDIVFNQIGCTYMAELICENLCEDTFVVFFDYYKADICKTWRAA